MMLGDAALAEVVDPLRRGVGGLVKVPTADPQWETPSFAEQPPNTLQVTSYNLIRDVYATWPYFGGGPREP